MQHRLNELFYAAEFIRGIRLLDSHYLTAIISSRKLDGGRDNGSQPVGTVTYRHAVARFNLLKLDMLRNPGAERCLHCSISATILLSDFYARSVLNILTSMVGFAIFDYTTHSLTEFQHYIEQDCSQIISCSEFGADIDGSIIMTYTLCSLRVSTLSFIEAYYTDMIRLKPVHKLVINYNLNILHGLD